MVEESQVPNFFLTLPRAHGQRERQSGVLVPKVLTALDMTVYSEEGLFLHLFLFPHNHREGLKARDD